MIFTNTGFVQRGKKMKQINFQDLAGQTIKVIHRCSELYIFCESGDICIIEYGDESGFRDATLGGGNARMLEYFAKKHNINLDGEIVDEINEINAREKRFEIRDYIIAKIKFERNTDKFNYWKVQDVMDTYVDPIQHVEEIIDKVLENYEEPETDEEIEE